MVSRIIMKTKKFHCHQNHSVDIKCGSQNVLIIKLIPITFVAEDRAY